MIDMLARLLVGHPGRILGIAMVVLAGYALRRRASPASSQWLLVAGMMWTLYAVWEWLVVTRTPEANIRVDLLVIWPVLAIVTIWVVIRAAR